MKETQEFSMNQLTNNFECHKNAPKQLHIVELEIPKYFPSYNNTACSHKQSLLCIQARV